mgnify:CR=1|jgi:hypothetical protein|tara:strand:- start:190 stop:354 length:165 start_codon:yes stop_codon:yes gene_type:complete
MGKALPSCLTFSFSLLQPPVSEVAWKKRVEKASPFSTLRSGNVDASAVWAVEMS